MPPAAVSYYRATAAPYVPYAPLSGRHEARVAVVGGGYAGLNTALGLAERGVRDVVLLERERIGFGASGRNGGFVFAGYSLGEQALLDRLGEARARALFRLTLDGVARIRRRIADYRIACDAVDAGVIWANWFRDPRVLRARQQLLAERYGVEWEWLPESALRGLVRSARYHDGLYERDALHLHPLNYAIGLAGAASALGVRIHEGSGAQRLERTGAQWRVRTAEGEVLAEQVVLACGGYLAGLERRIDRAILPVATYVMATEPLGDRLEECLATRAAVYDTRFAFDYYRPLPDTRLLWGGRISVLDRPPRAVQRLLLRDLLRVFPQLEGVRVEHAWSGLMSYARHQMPQLGGDGHGLWWAQAFGGHGLSSTCAAGELLAAAIAAGDGGWRQFADYGLQRTWRPLGFLAAQASYWRAGFDDWLKTRLEG
ncbi:NAD(P)/FAD-dependent oxidoreductase [Fulvimonas soli]|jgi:gamma-glutamylputrescine oxidase|uniref:Gamma-glutamylputrescine oxidase n=1 Tax=Fulvimonas soli TaxID=155197 RepID=A0A316IAS7_9GAMM|nr:FAD-binding oxidoreductase [Fulvimonas soli]PWK89829.1 gamma-glutamylputrescine oxidase [Fulvimonas soli]TNY27533.1 FAD-dependent oxidoreductase [Fulvimonas soli]